jgi:hypothetical protein
MPAFEAAESAPCDCHHAGATQRHGLVEGQAAASTVGGRLRRFTGQGGQMEPRNATDLQLVSVGEPFPLGPLPGNGEGNQVLFGRLGLAIVMYMHGPRPEEVGAIAVGKFEIRFLASKNSLMFVFRFGNTAWQDSPFTPHILPEELRSAPDAPAEGFGIVARVILVDAASTNVHHIRALTLSRSFSTRLLGAYSQLLGSPPDMDAHHKEVTRMQRKSTSALASEALDRFVQGETEN